MFAIKNVSAQHAHFPEEGKIMYEKTVYAKNVLKQRIASTKDSNWEIEYLERLLEKSPSTLILEKELKFNGNEISFLPIDKKQVDPIIEQIIRNGLIDFGTKAYQDLANNQSRTMTEYGGSKIYVQDSLLNVKWKITNEYREIAGYSCRRANGVVLDSVYVIAFYTDEIPLSAGPGLIHGLPGMILGYVVPEQHFHMYATKVEFTAPVINKEIAGKRDKPIKREEFFTQMKSSIISDWMTLEQVNMLIVGMLL